MTEEAQRIAIAEACGWTEISDWGAGGINGKHPTGPWVEVIPDYLNDLNAMHEVEKMLTNRQKEKYLDILSDFTEGRRDTSYVWHDTVFATAAQRAEAYLRTIGKWEGGADE